ncbi:hypothetical protein BDN71DRAFT_1432858 [Pleurotus eryngii]|uniref:Uncharacterized protein n=1 Tax=Pleurotus eryngii TaxID=5323 RepID=A0A9P5ZUG3_PLEER|nr:hypothetical protein BDN71DRAFT_1432858 [Pleurotus eryngii]
MARASNKPPDTLPRTPSKKKTPSKTKDAMQNAQLMTPAQDTPGPSTNSLLAQTVLTTDQWYRSRSTKNGYANYVKAGKKWVLLCQGDFWKLNEGKQKWEGNPVFQSDFKVYFESLKNRQNRTATVVQALPMLPADMKVLMDYLDTSEASKNIAEVRRLCWKAFATTSFCLWTRGGAQYHFMWAEHKWSLKAVKWWGGWSSGEEVNTIMRYLLDELTSYEEGFSDIMMASRPSERHKSFMATGDPAGHVTRNDFHELAMSLKKQLDSVVLSTPAPSPIAARYSPYGRPFATEDQRKYPDRMLTEQTPRRSKGRYSPCGRCLSK